MLKYRRLCSIARCFKLAAKSKDTKDTSCNNNILASQVRALHKCTSQKERMSLENYPGGRAIVKLMRKMANSTRIIKLLVRKRSKTWIGRDSPGCPVVKNPPSNAGDAGSIRGRGTRFPHAAGQLSPCATTTELVRLNSRAHVPQTTEPTCSGARSTTREEKTRTPQQKACTRQWKIPCIATKTWHS